MKKFYNLKVRKMKKLVYVFVFVLGVQLVHAQEDYVPFPKINATWSTLRINSWVEPAREVIMYSPIRRDSIEGILYQILRVHYLSGYTESTLAFREENKQVFVRIPNLSGEHLLYDFNLDIGDTIFYNVGGYYHRNDVYLYSSFHYKVVESIDTISLADGSKRKRFNLINSCDYPSRDTWVEGIGSTGWVGFLNPFINSATMGGDNYTFVCFEQNREVLYLNTFYCEDCSCRKQPNNVVDIVLSDIAIFPNPTTGELRITNYELRITNYELRIKKVELYGIVGNLVQSLYVEDNEIEMNIQNLQNGVYFVKITTEQGMLIKKIVKQ